MKKLLIALMLSIAACSSCATSSMEGGPWRSNRDSDAILAQEMMRTTVRIVKEVDLELTEDMMNDVTLAVPIKETKAWSGSGVVVENDDYRASKGSSLVMTAGHVCEVPESMMVIQIKEVDDKLVIIGGVAKVTAVRFKTITLDGRTLKTEVVSYTFDEEDSVPDVCAVSTVGVAGNAAPVARELPPEGAMIQNVGYPMGYQQRWAMHIGDGRYEGITDKSPHLAMVSVPAIGGLSGSGLFYRGKLFAILVSGYRSFHHMTFGTELNDVRREMLRARAKWLNQ